MIAVVVGCIWATAQPNAYHEVGVSIPDIIGIRIVGAGTGPRSITFDGTFDPTLYVAAIEGGLAMVPQGVARFDDIQVNSTHNGRWGVDVVATPWTYTGSFAGAGLPLEAITVRRGARSGLTQEAISGPGQSAWMLSSWSLSATSQRIAQRTGATGGWRSLGFNGWDYELVVTGSADPGSFVTVVTYSLSAP